MLCDILPWFLTISCDIFPDFFLFVCDIIPKKNHPCLPDKGGCVQIVNYRSMDRLCFSMLCFLQKPVRIRVRAPSPVTLQAVPKES